MRRLPSEPLSPQRILVIRLSALGDVIQVLPALEALGRLYPAARIDAVTESLSYPLLANHPRLDRVICFPRSEIRNGWKSPETRGEAREKLEYFREEIFQDYYDLIIDWQSNLRSAWIRSLTRHRRTLQLHPEDGGELPRWWPGYRPSRPAGRVHRVERAMHLVRQLGYSGETPVGEMGSDIPNRNAAFNAPILLHPFVSAFGRFKEWPISKWIQLATRLSDRGHVVWISGGPSDAKAVSQLLKATPPEVIAAPPTKSTADLGRMISECRAVVAADTGVIHLSAILGVSSVGLYGPKDPSVHGPYGPSAISLAAEIPCSPCLLRRCDHSYCMASISVDRVFDVLEKINRDSLAGKESTG